MKKKFLVVSGDSHTRNALCAMLESFDLGDVLVRTTAHHALAVLRGTGAGELACVFIDIKLEGADGTGLDGFRLTELIRNDPDWGGDFPVIGIVNRSASDPDMVGRANISLFLSMGANDFLLRPFDALAVWGKIDSHVNRERREGVVSES